MRIEVVVTEWEQACCGEAFHVGGEVTWILQAADPTTTAPRGLPRFLEEHHDQTPDDVPHWPVTGTVRRITGITYPRVPVPGDPRAFTLDRERPESTALTGIARAETTEHAEYLVEVDVADDAELPPFVASPSMRSDHDEAARAAARDRDRMGDVVGAELEATADRAEADLGGVSVIVRDRERSAVTIAPSRHGSAAVQWTRSDQDDDGIGVHIGDGSWWFPADLDHARLVGELLEAAAAGRVAEEVVELDGGGGRLDTVVVTRDGRRWVSSTSVEPFATGGGTMVIVGDLWERLQRGSRSSAPWSTAPRETRTHSRSPLPGSDIDE
ncbi:DUF6578 domain-containing protein [Microbacterium karelineae]|uniref:DUF6578 domain-containing protein n=1 Tax=Microbacterium karelineae TaxID=2654283 RepID=UPI0012EA4214|nr:DUF6578 domain-containing protein [Microbacterium karelineae]